MCRVHVVFVKNYKDLIYKFITFCFTILQATIRKIKVIENSIKNHVKICNHSSIIFSKIDSKMLKRKSPPPTITPSTPISTQSGDKLDIENIYK